MTQSSQYDVIVVGGGFAGVTATRELSRRGLRSLLLEARDRLGGRTFVADFAGQRVELGGAWVRWNQPFVWSEIQRYGLAIEAMPAPGAVQTLFSRGEAIVTGDDDDRDLVAAVRRFCEPAYVFHSLPYATATAFVPDVLDQMSVRQRLDRLKLTPRVYDMLDALFSTTCQASLDEASTTEMMRLFALSGFDAMQMIASLGQFKLKDGTSALIGAMIADATAEIRLASPITAVRQDADQVQIRLASGEALTARAALLTIPLNVLGSVDFEPELGEDKRRAIAQGHAGAGVKLYVKIRGDLGNIALLAPQGLPIGWGATVSNGPEGTIMMLFGIRHDAFSLDDVASVTQTLRQYLPKVEIEQILGWNWNADPYSRGTWCSLRPGQARLTVPAMQSAEGRVYFASGDTASGWRGFIDGAIERGLRVSQELYRALSPPPA